MNDKFLPSKIGEVDRDELVNKDWWDEEIGMFEQQAQDVIKNPPRLKLNPAGAGTFKIGADDGAIEFSAVVLGFHDHRGYWPEIGTGNPPSCSSPDGIKPDAIVEEPQNDRCSSCTWNVFGSGQGGSKGCKDMVRLYILIQEKKFPMIFSVPPTSRKVWERYSSDLFVSGVLVSRIVTKFTGGHRTTRAAKMEVSTVSFNKERNLEIDEIESIRMFAKMAMPILKGIPTTADDYEIPPEED